MNRFAETGLTPQPLTAAEQARLEQVEGIVFDIQRYSLHDGPGLRTNVFLKGCPLRCGWCANPESQQMAPQLALFAHNCIRCGQFADPCPMRQPEDNGSGWPQSVAAQFSERARLCPTGAIHWIGRRRTAGEVIREVLRDAPFYEDGGGMTLTGGEPTMQPHLAEALLRLAKAEYISTAMETCGHTRWAVLERLAPYLDHILFDLKHVNNAAHRAFTGLGNEQILQNLRRLVALNAAVAIRIPLIPGFNASEPDLKAIAGFILSLNGAVTSVDLLPYHTLGRAKYRALGREYPWQHHNRLAPETVESLADVFLAAGLAVNIGG